MSDAAFVEEAPESGKPYARKFQLWVETYDRVTLEQFITTVRGLAESAGQEADRAFTEANRAKAEADRAGLMANAAATSNQNCQTAVTSCTSLLQQTKTAEQSAITASANAGGYAQSAADAKNSAQADAGRATTQADRAKSEADRAQAIVDGFKPDGGGGGGSCGHSDLLEPELGSNAEPYFVTKADLGKTIVVREDDYFVWLGLDTGKPTDMAPGDYCDIVVTARWTPFVLRSLHGVLVTVAGGCSLAFTGPTAIRVQKLAANSWMVSSAAFDDTARNLTALLGNHIYSTGNYNVQNFPELARLGGRWDRVDASVRGAFLDAQHNVVIQQSTPLTGGNYDEWIRTMASGAQPDQPDSSGYADLVGEIVEFFGEWVRTYVNVRYIFGATAYNKDDNQHKLYIGSPTHAPKRLELVGYPADRYLVSRVIGRDDMEMARYVLQVWFYDKLGDKEIFRLFQADNGENDHVFNPSTLGAPNLDNYDIYAQWSGPKAYHRYDTLWGRSRDTGEYVLLEEGPAGWTPAQPWVERGLVPTPYTEPRFHTAVDNKAAIGWLDNDANLWLRLICTASVDYAGKKTIQDIQVPNIQVQDFWFGMSHNGFVDLYILDTQKNLTHIWVDWRVDQQLVNFNNAGELQGPWSEVKGQCRVWLPGTRMPGNLLVLRREHAVTTYNEFAVAYSGYNDYSGGSRILRLMHRDDAGIPWDIENLINYDLTVWGCWLEYSFHENRWGWWWGVQTTDGVWFFDRDRCRIPYAPEDSGGGPQ